MLHKPYNPADISVDDFAQIWEVWPEPLRAQAAGASSAERRKLAFTRYGLIPRPDDPEGLPLGYVQTADGGLAINCLACHGGKVEGRPQPAVGNSHFAFQTLAQDLLRFRQSRGQSLGPEAMMAVAFPLGRTNGTTNAQTFSVALLAMRDANLELLERPRSIRLEHYDLDAPPLWNTRHKRHLYIDGYVPKTHRVIMQFTLTAANSGAEVRSWDNDFRDVLAWIESLEPPPYPGAIDRALAARGETAFNRTCAECHGHYGAQPDYPEKRVPIDVVGTDAKRLTGMPAEHRRFFEQSWFNEDGNLRVEAEPDGYVAPPLYGIWASAPYFHNGSVPTLWHVLHPEARPQLWRRTEDGYDHDRLGLEVTTFDEIPRADRRGDARRTYFDAALPGKSAAGHNFPDELSPEEQTAVFEYLKTL
ncbi:MAG: cytochrome c [Pirellulales bacterium]|nr:cytochrome c [Pirellulales bacterium]